MDDWSSPFVPAAPTSGDSSAAAHPTESEMEQAVHAKFRHALKQHKQGGAPEKGTLRRAFKDLTKLEDETHKILEAERGHGIRSSSYGLNQRPDNHSTLDKFLGKHKTIDLEEACQRLTDPHCKAQASTYALKVVRRSAAIGRLYYQGDLPSVAEVVNAGYTYTSQGLAPQIPPAPHYAMPQRGWPQPQVQQWSAAAWTTSSTPDPAFSGLRRTPALRVAPDDSAQSRYGPPPKGAQQHGFSQ